MARSPRKPPSARVKNFIKELNGGKSTPKPKKRKKVKTQRV